jgi:hypothetical protein
MKVRALALAAGLALGTMGGIAHANYLVNGSFETGDFTGWTAGGNFSFTGVANSFDGYGPQDGNFFVFTGPIGSEGTLSQTFADTAGSTLNLSGWVAGNGTGPSDVRFLFNGNQVVFVGDPVPSQPYTLYSANVTATGNDTFTVAFYNSPDYDAIDNFSITAVPEPETYALMMAGLGLLGVVARRRKQKA